MAQSTADRLQSVLKNFETTTPDIEATAVVSTDGLVMASRLPADVEEERVGAMSAAILSLGERSGQELNRGDMQQVIVKGTQGYIVLMSVGSDAVLVTMTNEKVKLGLLFLELKRASEELSKLV
jgi:predicted regulator of Ras-like GTPase activity (Roadblock/LC7/MglB family)